MTPTQTLVCGSEIDGRYTVRRTIGSGAGGVVYLAHDGVRDEEVAVKVLAPLGGATAEARGRFRDEGRALALVRSPYVAAFRAAGRAADVDFLVMEHVAGTTLEDLIDIAAASGGYVARQQAHAVLGELARALAAIHVHGLVHGDVKPANVIVERATRRTVLVDLGFVRGAPGAAAIRSSAGTPAYVAPEALDLAHDIGPSADQYGLGCLAYELFTGRPPFVADSAEVVRHMHRREVPAPASSWRPSLPRAVDIALARALSKSADARYASCDAFVAALKPHSHTDSPSSWVERMRTFLEWPSLALRDLLTTLQA